jgi:2-aminoadipate transaminase
MDLRIDRQSAVPIFRQITRQIREKILSGELPAGFLLPPERRLAASLGVNRTTVLNAYRELKADGLVGGHVGRGTSVLPGKYCEPPLANAEPYSWRRATRSGVPRTEDPLVRDLLALTERSDVISLSAGLPSPEHLPIDLLRQIQDQVLSKSGRAALLHSPTEGVTALREAACGYLAARGIRCDVSEVLITSGSQQGLDLVVRTFLDPGDLVIVEEPSYFGALQVFRNAQIRLLGVPVDPEGMRTDLLEPLLERWHPRLIYTLPTFQNPSGALLSADRRKRILELAARYQVPVLEDDPYFDLRYEGRPVPPLKAMDPGGYVLYLSSFSKVLFPGLRLGLLAGPREALRKLALAKQVVDLHSNTLGQWLIAEFLNEGHYEAHLQRVRAAYLERRDALHLALRPLASAGVRWTVPQGGFYLWCRLPAEVSEARLLAEGAKEGVAFLPGAPCFPGEVPAPHVRLNYSYCTPAQIALGAEKFGRALRTVVSEERSRGPLREETPPLV